MKRYSKFIPCALIMLVGIAVAALVISAYNDRSDEAISKLPKVKPFPAAWGNKTLIDMNIRCSHNSYMRGFQHLSPVSVDAVIEVLDMGARSIELDIVKVENNPYIAHGSASAITSLNVIQLKTMLRVIDDNVFKDIDDPLILFLEIHDKDDEAFCAKIKDELLLAFGQKLRYYHGLSDKGLSDTTLNELRGQVVVIANTSNPALSMLLERRYEWANVGSRDPNSLSKRGDQNVLWRVFPENKLSALSSNINSKPFIDYEYNLIAMNFGSRDKNLYDYLSYFGEYTMRPRRG